MLSFWPKLLAQHVFVFMPQWSNPFKLKMELFCFSEFILCNSDLLAFPATNFRVKTRVITWVGERKTWGRGFSGMNQSGTGVPKVGNGDAQIANYIP